MDLVFASFNEACRVVVNDTLSLLYYSHIPTAIAILLISAFVFFKDNKSLVSKLLFLIALFFSLWSLVDLIVWLQFDKSSIVMLAWSFFGFLYLSIYVFSLYFFYVFVEKKDISFVKKIFLGLILSPTIILAPTKFNLEMFDAVNCQPFDGVYFSNYYYLAGFAIFLWIIGLAIVNIRKTSGEQRKAIIFLTIGIEFFLFSFFSTGFLMNYLIYEGILNNYDFEQYGLFGMPIFIGFLAYLIVRFKAFNIKLLGAQALVVTLVGLVAAEFFFTPLENTTSVVLIGVTVLLSTVFGIVLVNSVKKEEKRKEELQLMSDKLAEANDKLRKLDNTKSEFISIASHQLRTPLTAIRGFISLLLEGSYGKINAKQEDALNKVYTSNDRLVTLVEDLLNVSRIESGRMEFKLVPTKIEDICQEVADTLMMKAKGRKLYLDYQLPKTPLPELVIDGTKVREVISNMVDNAVKYTEKGGVTLRTEKTPDAVRVIVADTGIGIPKEELPYLFSKFSRGKDTARLNTGGTGLGLYVGKAMIEQNGGKIWAESEGAGKGSRFIIELPIKQDEELLKRWGSQG